MNNGNENWKTKYANLFGQYDANDKREKRLLIPCTLFKGLSDDGDKVWQILRYCVIDRYVNECVIGGNVNIINELVDGFEEVFTKETIKEIIDNVLTEDCCNWYRAQQYFNGKICPCFYVRMGLLFDIAKGNFDEWGRCVLLVYWAMRSIIGTHKKYVKTTWGMILSRAAGYVKTNNEDGAIPKQLMQFASMNEGKYWRNKLINKLTDSFGLRYANNRGAFISFDESIDIEEVARRFYDKSKKE